MLYVRGRSGNDAIVRRSVVDGRRVFTRPHVYFVVEPVGLLGGIVRVFDSLERVASECALIVVVCDVTKGFV